MKKYSSRRGFTVLPGAILYAAVLVFALVFTQILRTSITNTLFWFLLILPVLSLLHALLGRTLLQVYVMSDVTSAEKLTPVEYEIRVINTSPLPFPFVDALTVSPNAGGVRSNDALLSLSVVSFGSYSMKQTVTFPYRGLYEIGVRDLYVTDILRIFRIRKRIDNYSNVTVMPRRLTTSARRPYAAELSPQNASKNDSAEKSDVGNIREYIPGDSLKSIHWKLSSKTDELEVREFNSSTARRVFIFCDLSVPEVREADNAVQSEDNAPLAIRKQRTLRYNTELAGDDDPDKISLGEVIGDAAKDAANAVTKKRIAAKKRRSVRRGMSAEHAETVGMIDELIASTARKKVKKSKSVPENDDAAVDNTPVQPSFSARRLAARIKEVSSGGGIEKHYKYTLRDTDMTAEGSVRDEYANEYAELLADCTVETAIAVLLDEARHGSECTIAWFDSRSDAGCEVFDITDQNDVEAAVSRLSTAPVQTSGMKVCELLDIAGQASNVTMRIVTPNMSPADVSDYSSVPAKFGGSGAGAQVQVFLSCPDTIYEDSNVRASYIESCRLTLLHSGVMLTEGTGNTPALYKSL